MSISSHNIKKVALAGAAGNVGPSILNALLKNHFDVTVLTRKGSTNTSKLSADVKSVPVDYESIEALTSALKGQDALVVTLGGAAIAVQLRLVEAAKAAGVKRFIPSEFGSNTSNSNVIKLPPFVDKHEVQNALKEAAKTSNMTYTLVNNGPFLDWGTMIGWLINVPEKSIVLHDGGDRVFSTSTLPHVGQAVVGVLQHPQETENRTVYIQSTATSLKKLLKLGHNATGGSEGWTVKEISIDEQLAEGWGELKKEKPNPGIFIMKFINAACYGGGYGAHFEKLDNELLGIKQLTEEELQDLVSSYAKKAAH